MKHFTAEVLCVGNELLLGRTVDTNSNYICTRVYELGGDVRRVTVVPDDTKEISSAMLEISGRGSSWAVVTGGLGPTYDDKTLEGLAMALGVPLRLSRPALRFVEDSVRRRGRTYVLSRGLISARRKMATLPLGSRPLPNPVGTAPGVLAVLGRTSIVCLPGVPAEMKGIFEESVVPMMTNQPGSAETIDVEVVGVPEAAMAPLLARVATRFPELYVKSHPASVDNVSKVVIQVTGRGTGAHETTRRAAETITDWLGKTGASYRLVRPEKHESPAN